MGNEMASVGIAIPKVLIEDTIRAEIVRQLGNSTSLVEAVVKTAMNEKSTDERYRYSRGEAPTVFQHAINEMIQEEAKRIFREWLEKNRKLLADALVRNLEASKAGALKKLAESIVENANLWRMDVSLKIGE